MRIDEAFIGCDVEVNPMVWGFGCPMKSRITAIVGNRVQLDGSFVDVRYCERLPQYDGIYTCEKCDARLGDDGECHCEGCELSVK